MALESLSAVEFFVRGSASKNNLSPSIYTLTVSGSAGFALGLLPGIRLEARYTNNTSLQNQLEINNSSATGYLNDIFTQTSMYSLGLDINFLSERSVFQPYIYLGGGYVETARSYYYVNGTSDMGTELYYEDPIQQGASLNVGLGFRLRIIEAVAFEAEAFAYFVDPQKPIPIINLMGQLGIRVFI